MFGLLEALSVDMQILWRRDIVVKAVNGALKHHSDGEIVPALGANVIIMLATQVLLGVGFLVAAFLQI